MSIENYYTRSTIAIARYSPIAPAIVIYGKTFIGIPVDNFVVPPLTSFISKYWLTRLPVFDKIRCEANPASPSHSRI